MLASYFRSRDSVAFSVHASQDCEVQGYLFDGMFEGHVTSLIIYPHVILRGYVKEKIIGLDHKLVPSESLM